MSKNERNKSALEQVDVRRRGFLGKLLAGGAAAAAIPAMSTIVLGQDERSGIGKAKGGKGKGEQGGKGKAEGKGKGVEGGGRPDSERMAAQLIKAHDKDGDGALNSKELTAALTAMMERRQGGQAKGKGKGDGAKGTGESGGGEGKGKRGESSAGGGVLPQRPPVEE